MEIIVSGDYRQVDPEILGTIIMSRDSRFKKLTVTGIPGTLIITYRIGNSKTGGSHPIQTLIKNILMLQECEPNPPCAVSLQQTLLDKIIGKLCGGLKGEIL